MASSLVIHYQNCSVTITFETCYFMLISVTVYIEYVFSMKFSKKKHYKSSNIKFLLKSTAATLVSKPKSVQLILNFKLRNCLHL